MKITCDWHIHSRHSCECYETGTTLGDITAGAARCGITDFGVTDHLHSRYNLGDIVASRDEYDRLIREWLAAGRNLPGAASVSYCTLAGISG